MNQTLYKDFSTVTQLEMSAVMQTESGFRNKRITIILLQNVDGEYKRMLVPHEGRLSLW